MHVCVLQLPYENDSHKLMIKTFSSCATKRGRKKKTPSFPISVFLGGGKFYNLVKKKMKIQKLQRIFWRKKWANWHFIIHQFMGRILNFSTSPLTSSQIWLNPLVHDWQPTSSLPNRSHNQVWWRLIVENY
jgi:hypothetical protein